MTTRPLGTAAAEVVHAIDRSLQHRTVQVEGMAALDAPQPEEGSKLRITPAAARSDGTGPHPKPHPVDGRDPEPSARRRPWRMSSTTF